MSNRVPTAITQAGSAIELCRVSKHYLQRQQAASLADWFHPKKRQLSALDDVSFTVRRGEFLAYAGPNGAGKSTTIKLLSGMLAPSSGELSVLGLSPLKDRIPLMRRVGVLFGNRRELWSDHPVSASFRWKREVWGVSKADFEEMEALVLELLDIRPFYQSLARELSLGQRMRAELGLMLLHRPELILLDEPTLGLDVLAKRQIIGFLKDLNAREGTTILVTSHDMDDLEEMARRILLISSGKIAFDGDFSALRGELRLNKKALVRLRGEDFRELPYDDMGALLRELSALENVEEIEFTQSSLEEGLADLFLRWKKPS
ncbi:MAG: ATP-binding cassette domain-containing protein [Christensenellaceae bacterium]|jgi:ABC-2 type transport system ATP-binding protein|nr:ATP-binding cassette domain-containing protein [Christensenellaceae bacterium]